MLKKEDIAKIHRKLSEIYGSGTVLLGGSYLYGEAEEGSDLDFYLISNLHWFINYIRHKELLTELKENFPILRVMLVSRMFFKRGWYYIYGRDISGKAHVSGVNKKIIFRNSLKLACFHYLKFLLSNSASDKKKFLIKSAQQAAVAAVIKSSMEKINPNDPLFSRKIILENLVKYEGKHREIIEKILNWKKDAANPDMNSLNQAGRQLLGVISGVLDSAGSLLSFLPINYLIYNSKFLFQGNKEFLFCNPDKKLLNKIVNGIKTSINLEELHREMKETIFPVFII